MAAKDKKQRDYARDRQVQRSKSDSIKRRQKQLSERAENRRSIALNYLLSGGWEQSGLYLAIVAIVSFVTTAGDLIDYFDRWGLWLSALVVIIAGVLVFRRKLARPGHSSGDIALALALVLAITVTATGIYRLSLGQAAATSAQVEVLTKASISLPGTTLDDVNFPNGKLEFSDLRDAHLIDVDLSGADLTNSDIRGAIFNNVNMSGAKLCGVDARGADLSGARGLGQVDDWRFFIYDKKTKFPSGFVIDAVAGPIDSARVNLLISCDPGQTRLLQLK